MSGDAAVSVVVWVCLIVRRGVAAPCRRVVTLLLPLRRWRWLPQLREGGVQSAPSPPTMNSSMRSSILTTRDAYKVPYVRSCPSQISTHDQGGVKSTPSSPRFRVGVILTDSEPLKEAL